MLSYRHSFHAGNFADILKHIVVVEILLHLRKKEKPFEYIDTHAGAGLFDLQSEDADKLKEYESGIGNLKIEDWPELASYFEVINAYNKSKSLRYYPGSPLLAMHFLRRQDKAWLYELHPQDIELLWNNTRKKGRVKVTFDDGFIGLLSLLPPQSRRCLILIDPSYEIKSDYEQVFTTVNKAYQKFATGIYAIWHPVVNRHKIKQLERKFINSGIKDIQRFEFGLSADSDELGMTSAGMLVINPPWGLFDKMSGLLPKLVRTLAVDDDAFFKCDVLVGE